MQAPTKESDEYKPAVSRKSASERSLSVLPAPKKLSGTLQVERWYPLTGAVAVAAATAYFRAHTSIFEWDRQVDFVTKVIDVAAAFSTYALTVVTVLPALRDRSSVHLLRSRGNYKYFTRFLSAALGASVWLLVFGLTLKFGFYHISLHHRFWAPLASSIWWASCTYAGLTLLRASLLLLGILRSD